MSARLLVNQPAYSLEKLLRANREYARGKSGPAFWFRKTDDEEHTPLPALDPGSSGKLGQCGIPGAKEWLRATNLFPARICGFEEVKAVRSPCRPPTCSTDSPAKPRKEAPPSPSSSRVVKQSRARSQQVRIKTNYFEYSFRRRVCGALLGVLSTWCQRLLSLRQKKGIKWSYSGLAGR